MDNVTVLGLRDYVNKNGFANQSPSVLLGLSGGVDSAFSFKMCGGCSGRKCCDSCYVNFQIY